MMHRTTTLSHGMRTWITFDKCSTCQKKRANALKKIQSCGLEPIVVLNYYITTCNTFWKHEFWRQQINQDNPICDQNDGEKECD
jgi:hypothetical protein